MYILLLLLLNQLLIMTIKPISSNRHNIMITDPGVGHFFLMENLDHLDICKPRCRDSVLYHMTKEFIQSCVEQSATTK